MVSEVRKPSRGTTKRGGAAHTPLHWAKIAAVTVLLMLASVAMIMQYYLLGWVLTVAAITLWILQERGR